MTENLLQFRIGSAIYPPERPAIIAHSCNDIGAWGAGFSGFLSKRWPLTETRYRGWHQCQLGFRLGAVQFVHVDNSLWIANLIAQHGIGSRTSARIQYEALQKALTTTTNFALEAQASVHMPRIGCGFGGGEWSRVEQILTQTLLASSIPVFVYDLRPEIKAAYR